MSQLETRKNKRHPSDPNIRYQDDDDLPFPPGGVSRAFDKESSSANEDDYEHEEAHERNKIVLDTFYLIGKGSFLPAALLLDNNVIDPARFIVDPNTGARVAHYAAHHGNLKFLRWYEAKYGAAQMAGLRDDYNCSLLHYAVRQGHLPAVMFLEKTCGMPLRLQDKFGYSALEYAMVYKRVYCFIYLFKKCGFTTINPALINKIVDILLDSDDQ